MEAEEKSVPEESESAELPDTGSDSGAETFEPEMPDADSEEEIPEAEELAEELTEGILSEPEIEAVSAEPPVEPEHLTAEPAEPPKTEAQDEEIPAAEETEAEQLCRKKEKHSFKKFGWAYGLAAAFALLLFVTFAYTSLVPREVNATINGQNYKVESKAFTIEEFLDEQHIKYCEDDYISRPVSS